MNDLKNSFYILNMCLITCLIATVLFMNSVSKIFINGPKPLILFSEKPFRKDMNNLRKLSVPLSQIYGKRDIFGLFTESAAKGQSKDLVSSAIPKLIIPEIKSMEPEKPVVFIDPLPISLNAIILSSDIDSSVCVISDETDKEVIYHVGDRFKDAVLIKLLRDRVIFLRLNGQIETYFLHNNSVILPKEPSEAITKNDSNNFVIDKNKFINSIQSFGSFLDYFESVPFSGEDGKLIGFVVTEKNEKGLAKAMGFNEFDLILSIDGISFESNKNRMSAYDHVVQKAESPEASFEVEYERDGAFIKNFYLIVDSNASSTFLKSENSSGSATFELINRQPSEKRKALNEIATLSKNFSPSSDNQDSIFLQERRQAEEKIFIENLETMREAMMAKQNSQKRNS